MLLLLVLLLTSVGSTVAFLPYHVKLNRVLRNNVKPSVELQLSSKANSIISNSSSNVMNMELNDELKKSFMSYAMSTILSRALPDARDGLKPVHRRVLYAMQILNLTPDSGYRKCARIVGEVLGKYHPHGDQSVYAALVRMAQDFVMLHPLVTGHGNFGSVDDDPPAAMRYTEAKLSCLAYDSLLCEVKEDTVDFISNFDGNEIEPVVLPARLPMLLVNGASGIAVGMATNIPPHNIGELSEAIIALIDNPCLSNEELYRIVPAPDFPTGGTILGLQGVHKLYTTGHGGVILRAKTHIEMIPSGSTSSARNRNAIVVTELPFMTNKAELLLKISDLVNDKKLEGIADLRDETNREGLRIVIELKKDAVTAVVLNNLFKKTALQSSFSGNMLALVECGTQPKRISLRQAIQIFIKFRFGTIRRRTAYKLNKLLTRDHVVQGMLLALQRIDDIINIMKTSKDSSTARDTLMSDKYKFSGEQADAIMSLTLRRLTALEESKLQEEHNELTVHGQILQQLMNEDDAVYAVMKKETVELQRKYQVPRRTTIQLDDYPAATTAGELPEEDLIVNTRSLVVITNSGYIKRMPVDDFETQRRGGRGKAAAKLSTNTDSVSQFITCSDHDMLLCITDRGVVYSKKAYQIPLASRTAKGVPLPQVLPIDHSVEKITAIIPIHSFNDVCDDSNKKDLQNEEMLEKMVEDDDVEDDNDMSLDSSSDSNPVDQQHGNSNKIEPALILLTTGGMIKRTLLKEFQSIRCNGKKIIKLNKGDSLKWARRCDFAAHQEVVLSTKNGYAARYRVQDIALHSRASHGVRALKLRPGDRMADIDIIEADEGKQQPDLVTETSDATNQQMHPIDNFNSNSDSSSIVNTTTTSTAVSTPSSYFIIVTERGYGKRMLANAFSRRSRNGKGVMALKFKTSKVKKEGTMQAEIDEDEEEIDKDDDEEEEDNGKLKTKKGIATTTSTAAAVVVQDALSCLRVCHAGDEIVISTSKGTVLRQRVDDIGIKSRTSTGVKIQNLSNDDKIVSIDIVKPVVDDD